MSSAFSKAAPAITASVAGIFGAATGSAAGLKNEIVAGISALEGQSFGNDATLGFKPSVLGL